MALQFLRYNPLPNRTSPLASSGEIAEYKGLPAAFEVFLAGVMRRGSGQGSGYKAGGWLRRSKNVVI
jgi:hypothetical protein